MKDDGRRFAQIPEAVLYADVSGNAVRLYGILQRHVARRTPYHPSRAELAALSRSSIDSVDRGLRELAKSGLVVISKAGSFNRYQLLEPTEEAANLRPVPPGGSRKSAVSSDARKPQNCGPDAANMRRGKPQICGTTGEIGESSSIEEERDHDHDLSGYSPEILCADWFPAFEEILSWLPPGLRTRPDNEQPAEILAKNYSIAAIREKRKALMGEPFFLRAWPHEILDAFGRDFKDQVTSPSPSRAVALGGSD
ncbi:MAG: hypothetical protein FIB00_10450 [Chloroflexi bacterium]|nr:hypothetical protein [Chloroflexota bacterium]PWB42698.1 MAG: hypothetical protein C3F10_13230 [Dehalococcoidia bacterium]